MVNSGYPSLRGHCGEACLGLGLDLVPKQTIFNVLQRNVRKTIKYENAFPTNKDTLLSEYQIKYVEDVIVKRDIAKIGMSRK